MPRSTGSKQPQAAAGGGSPNTAAPKNAVDAIKRFLGGNIALHLFLTFLLESLPASYKFENYKAVPITLPEVGLTSEIVSTWLLTLFFRKHDTCEPSVTDDSVWHRVILFLRENRECEQLKLLFKFLKKHECSRILPDWVKVVLCPICDFDSGIFSSMISYSSKKPRIFWQNILQGLSPSLLPFWLNEPTQYIAWFLLFELLQQQPLTQEVRGIIHAFLLEKPFEFFSRMPIDLLILLSHYEFITESIVNNSLFNESRRFEKRFPITFLDKDSMQNGICQIFFKKHFPSISGFLSKNPSFGISFENTFVYPHIFFQKLLNGRVFLEKSGIQIIEMRKYLNLFCWYSSTFFSFDNAILFKQIMLMSDPWKFLFIQLWRIETEDKLDFHVSALMRYVCKETKCIFSKQLFDILNIFVRQVVVKSPDRDKLTFFKWLLSQDITIHAHFQLTPELVDFCLKNFPTPSTKKIIFWWIFIVESALNYQRPERDLAIDMDEVCQRMGLEISEEEIGLNSSGQLILNIGTLASMFNVITLVFKFSRFNYRRNFTWRTYCDRLLLDGDGFNPFRVLIYWIKSSLNCHMKPNGPLNRMQTLVSMCETKNTLLVQMSEEDRNFLKALFSSYLEKIVLSEELMQLLHRLSKVFPKDVKQHMFETCLPLKMLDAEKAGRKRSRDPTDPDSYEADCSKCLQPYPLPQLGLDTHGDPICRVCSQRFGIVIQIMLGVLPFAEFDES